MRFLLPLAFFLTVFAASVGECTYTCEERALAGNVLDRNVGDCVQKGGAAQSVANDSGKVDVPLAENCGSHGGKVAEAAGNAPYGGCGLASFVFLMALRLLLVALSAIAVA